MLKNISFFCLKQAAKSLDFHYVMKNTKQNILKKKPDSTRFLISLIDDFIILYDHSSNKKEFLLNFCDLQFMIDKNNELIDKGSIIKAISSLESFPGLMAEDNGKIIVEHSTCRAYFSFLVMRIHDESGLLLREYFRLKHFRSKHFK